MRAVERALVGNPLALLLDEAFEGLAPLIADDVVHAFRTLHETREMGMWLVEQHAELALELTEKTIVLVRGRIRWQGESRLLLSDPERLAQLIGLDVAEESSDGGPIDKQNALEGS